LTEAGEHASDVVAPLEQVCGEARTEQTDARREDHVGFELQQCMASRCETVATALPVAEVVTGRDVRGNCNGGAPHRFREAGPCRVQRAACFEQDHFCQVGRGLPHLQVAISSTHATPRAGFVGR